MLGDSLHDGPAVLVQASDVKLRLDTSMAPPPSSQVLDGSAGSLPSTSSVPHLEDSLFHDPALLCKHQTQGCSWIPHRHNHQVHKFSMGVLEVLLLTGSTPQLRGSWLMTQHCLCEPQGQSCAWHLTGTTTELTSSRWQHYWCKHQTQSGALILIPHWHNYHIYHSKSDAVVA